MKNLILISAITLSVLSCTQPNKATFAKISGTIKNVQQTEMRVVGMADGKRISKIIPVNEDGSFSDTLNISSGKFLLLVNGPNPAKARVAGDTEPRKEIFSLKSYFEAGSETNFDLDAANFYGSLKMSGDYAAYTMYNYNKDVLKNDLKPSNGHKELYSKDETSFKKQIKKLKNENDALLAASDIVVDGFKEEESRLINYEYLLSLSSYEKNHAYYSENNEFKVEDGFLAELDEISYSNAVEFKNLAPYRSLVFFNLEDQTNKMVEEGGIPKDIAMIRVTGSIEDEGLKNQLLGGRASGLMGKSKDITSFYNEFMKYSTDERNNARITALYNKLNILAKGSPSPKFENYENFAGGTTSLDDLKGKYVYIDMWATWCGPCKGEIPYLKKVEKLYHGKNIEFVSISVDKQKDRQKWLDMVKNMELGGVQLLADKDAKSQFYQDYAITGIPRFILLDPKGNIVNVDAPRPSNKELIDLFDSLNI